MGKRKDRLTRRRLLAGAAGATAAGLSLGACTSRGDRHWDLESDVVVVGSGVGACTAALIASRNGNGVRMLEKAAEPGGTTAKSAGVLWIPNNFTLRERGIADERDACIRYMARFSYPDRYAPGAPGLGLARDELALLEAFYDNAAPATEALMDMGALRLAEWRMFQLDRPATDYLDDVPENKVPAGRALAPVAADGTIGLGDELIRQLTEALSGRGVEMHLGHRVTTLVQDEQGRVLGVEAATDGGTVSVRARRATVFATGGYAHNLSLVRRHQPAYLYGSCAKEVSTGDFIAIAGAAGAAMGDLSGAWRTQIVLDEALVSRYLAQGVFYPPGDSMIQVNRYGRRAVDENRNYNDRTEVHAVYDPTEAEYPNQLMFMIYDQRTAETFAGVYPLPEKPDGGVHVIRGDTLAGLGEALDRRLAEIENETGGLRLAADFARNLEATVQRFNGFAVAGRDADFDRGGAAYDSEWHAVFSPRRPDSPWPPNPYPSVTMHPFRDEGPYYAIILAAGALDTNGGPLIDAGARVLNGQGLPIPGLYGAGNCIASPSRDAYYGAGHTLAMSLTFAYIAANSLQADTAVDGG